LRKNSELAKIENETQERVLAKLLDNEFKKVIEAAAITVLAGYYWARDRNFDPLFDQEAYDDDRRHAEKKLREMYEDKKTLQQIINEMINRQANVIWRRRRKQGDDEGYSYYRYQQDRWEAKRYVAYLFFEEIRKNCFEKGICPDFGVNLIGKEVINLLKSLTVEEYCKIKGYLSFLERTAHGFDKDDYLKAMDDLDNTFLNCNCLTMKRICGSFGELLGELLDDEEKIKKAKYSPQDRLGYIDQKAIEDFVNGYYSFIKKAVSIDENHKDAEPLLTELYHKANSKIINMMEFLLKCMIASYVNLEIHSLIRLKFDKTEIKKVKKVPHKNEQIDPLFK
jgi:hypothetical protein